MSSVVNTPENSERAKRFADEALDPTQAPKKKLQKRAIFAPPRPYEQLILQKGFDLESPVKRVELGIRKTPNVVRYKGKRVFELAVHFVDLVNNRYIDMPLETFQEIRKRCFLPFQNYLKGEPVDFEKFKFGEYTVSLVSAYNGKGMRINQSTPAGIVSIVLQGAGIEKFMKLRVLLHSHILEIFYFKKYIELCFNSIVKFGGQRLPDHLIGRHIRADDVVNEIDWFYCKDKIKKACDAEIKKEVPYHNLKIDRHRCLVIFEELKHHYRQQIAEDITQDHLELQYFGEIL